MVGWQPIDTAPKDWRKSVLLYWPSYAYNIDDEGCPMMDIGRWVENVRGASYWSNTAEYDCYGLTKPEHQPSHWMPLPEPPK